DGPASFPLGAGGTWNCSRHTDGASWRIPQRRQHTGLAMKLPTLVCAATKWNEGFLGTAAPLTADLVLLLEIAMGAALLAGAWLARRRRFQQHARCQATVVLLNLVVISLGMIPSFREQVLPRIPLKLSKAYVALATAHATLGSVTELAALYILLAAGT